MLILLALPTLLVVVSVWCQLSGWPLVSAVLFGLCRIYAWRRRLLCSVCQLTGCGACIRCEMPSCTNAFHAMCAQNAGVYMRLEPAFIAANGSRSVPARRTVYCDLHRPVETVSDKAEFPYKLNGCSLKPSKKHHDGASLIMSPVVTSLHIPTNKWVTLRYCLPLSIRCSLWLKTFCIFM